MNRKLFAATLVATGVLFATTNNAFAETDIVKTKTYTAAPEATTTIVSPGAVEEQSTTTTVAPGFEEQTTTTTSSPVVEERTTTVAPAPSVEEKTTIVKKHHKHFIFF